MQIIVRKSLKNVHKEKLYTFFELNKLYILKILENIYFYTTIYIIKKIVLFKKWLKK